MWRTTGRLRCPACGEGELFRSGFGLRRSCAVCGLDLVGPSGAQYGGAIALGYGAGGVAGLGTFILLVGWLGYADWMVWAAVLVVVSTVLATYRHCKAWWTWWLHAAGELRGGRPR